MKQETKIELSKLNKIIKPEIVLNVKDKIIKKSSGIYHDEHGKLLYKPDRTFDCLCLKCDKELIVHLTKLLISLIILLFSMLMLYSNRGDSAFYCSIISLVLGTFLGTHMKQSSNNNKN
jgi:hypothetical protein